MISIIFVLISKPIYTKIFTDISLSGNYAIASPYDRLTNVQIKSDERKLLYYILIEAIYIARILSWKLMRLPNLILALMSPPVQHPMQPHHNSPHNLLQYN